MTQWARVPTSAVLAEMIRSQHKTQPPLWVALVEFSCIVTAGQVGDWSERALAARWGGSRRFARRVIRRAFVEADATGASEPQANTHLHQCWTTARQCFPALATPTGPQADHKRTTSEPRARSSSLEREKEKEIWSELDQIRAKHVKGTRSRSLTAARQRSLSRALRDLKAAGFDDPRTALLEAARWAHSSTNIRASGARSTGDAVEVLLRAKHTVTYAELARDEAANGAVDVVELELSPWERQERAHRQRFSTWLDSRGGAK